MVVKGVYSLPLVSGFLLDAAVGMLFSSVVVVLLAAADLPTSS